MFHVHFDVLLLAMYTQADSQHDEAVMEGCIVMAEMHLPGKLGRASWSLVYLWLMADVDPVYQGIGG